VKDNEGTTKDKKAPTLKKAVWGKIRSMGIIFLKKA
jgi:hypothetical protein